MYYKAIRRNPGCLFLQEKSVLGTQHRKAFWCSNFLKMLPELEAALRMAAVQP